MGINKPPATGKLGGTAKKVYKLLMRLITNQDENDDGIDDRYQSTSYNREMSRRGSIITSTLERSGTINVLQGTDLQALQEKHKLLESKQGDFEVHEEDTPEKAAESAKATLNWE